MITYEQITPEMLEEYLVIVNCTPCGMSPHYNECPKLPYEALTSRHILYDLIYNPDETLFLKKGKAQGAMTKNGLEMLLLQADESWRIWNERKRK
jgi:shikimate dehydrogenase